MVKNNGAAHCRNFAIKQTNSPYIAFIDSDDLWEKNKLKAQVEFMKKIIYHSHTLSIILLVIKLNQ